MKPIHALAIFMVPLALSACGGEEPEPTDGSAMNDTAMAPTAIPTDTGAMAGAGGMEQMVNLQAVGNSGVTGQATVTPAGAQTRVAVNLRGLQPNSAHAGHIHSGTCESPGAPVQPLPEITADANGSGTATTTVSVASNTVLNGQHIVMYHQNAGGNPGAPVVCGAIPAHQM